MRINLDNPVIRFLGGVFDTAVAVTLGVLCCLPVITLGPALTAMYRTMMDVASDQCGGVVKTFFRAFRENLSQGMVLGLLLLAVAAVLAGDIWVCWGFRHEAGTTVSVMRGLTVACTVLYFGWGSYVLPGLAQFQVTNRQAIRNAAVWAVRNPAVTMGLVASKLAAAAAVYLMWYLCLPVLWILVYADARLLNRAFGVRELPNREQEEKNQEIYYE